MGGSIKGFVKPDTLMTAVYAIKGTDTFGTYTSNGSYMIRGLAAGSYNILYVPTDTTYQSATKTGITVTVNNVIPVDTVTLIR